MILIYFYFVSSYVAFDQLVYSAIFMCVFRPLDWSFLVLFYLLLDPVCLIYWLVCGHGLTWADVFLEPGVV